MLGRGTECTNTVTLNYMGMCSREFKTLLLFWFVLIMGVGFWREEGNEIVELGV